MPETLYHSLRLDDLQLQVRLGVSNEERAISQTISVGVELRFVSPPVATATDKIGDTLCYARLADCFRKHCLEHEFHLVEKLATDLFKLAGGFVEGRAKVSLSLCKLAPPVEGLRGGATYRIGEFS